MKKTVVLSLIGRPNVGKSTIFNRLMGDQHLNITHDRPGVTRDRHYGIIPDSLLGFDEEVETPYVYLVDTGGFYPDMKDHLVVHSEWNKANSSHSQSLEEVRKRDLFQRMAEVAEMSIQESDLVLLVVDVREGLLPFDQLIVDSIRKHKRDFVVLVNKTDSFKQDDDVAQFYALGVDEERMFPLSAAHGKGLLDLSEYLAKYILKCQEKRASVEKSQLREEILAGTRGLRPREKVVGSLAIVGAPNAGKSTLLNRLLGSERALVSPVPGTTVDPISGYFDLYFGKNVEELLGEKKAEDHQEQHEEQQESLEEPLSADLQEEGQLESQLNSGKSYWRSLKIVDTAGIRKKKSVQEYVETQSVYRALRSIEESDIVLYLIDATKGIGHQDSRLCDIILEKGKSLILCLNKMDLMEKTFTTPKAKKEWWEKLKNEISWLDFCEVLPISAKTGKALKAMRDAIKRTVEIRANKIPTGKLNKCINSLIDKNPIMPKQSFGKKLKVKYTSMVKSGPPTFLMFSNLTENIPSHYRRYLINGIRKEFDLKNTPIHLIFRSSSKSPVDDSLQI